MSDTFRIAVLPGDGIGPEVMSETLRVLECLKNKYQLSLEYQTALVGGAAIDAYEHPLPKETLEICEGAQAILFGSVGGPKWDHLPPELTPERGSLLPLRKHFGLFCNLRPTKLFPSISHLSPLKDDIVADGFDILTVRELTGGIYFGVPRTRSGSGDEERALDSMTYKRSEIKRVGHLAFQFARQRRGKVTSIDKANVLASMVLWREVIDELSKQYPDVTLEHLYVDNAAMQLIKRPSDFDVLLAPNLFGDILSDQCAMLTGSLGLLPSASINESKFGLYEPAGGSAPDIAGKGIANPIAQILSMALMFQFTFNRTDISADIQEAIQNTLEEGTLSADLHKSSQKSAGTKEITDRVIFFLENSTKEKGGGQCQE